MTRQLNLFATASQPLSLRDFQKEVVSELYAQIKTGTNPILLVAPTGSGKTVMMSKIIFDARSRDRPCTFIVHRDPLIEQTRTTLQRYGIEAGIIKASYKPDMNSSVQIASIQTLNRRKHLIPELFAPGTVCLIDEAHTTSFHNCTQEILSQFKENCIFIGATATPWRLKKQEGLAEIYQSMVSTPIPEQLMSQGWLVKPTYYSFPAPDLSKIRSSDGEYKQSDLSIACNTPVLIERIIKEWHRLAKDKSTIAFAVDIKHSQAIAQEFNRQGVPAEHLDANTPIPERQQIYQRLKNKETLVLSSVGVLTEGFDVPSIECVLLCRPTKSKALHHQMLGRGVRIAPGKKTCIVLDQSENCKRHGLLEDIRVYEMDSANTKPDEPPPMKECPECNCFLYAFQMVCPQCGYDFPLNQRMPTEEMVELSPRMKRSFQTLLYKAFAKEHSPNSAVYGLRRIFKLPDNWQPPNEWWLNTIWGGRKNKEVLFVHRRYLEKVAERKGRSLAWVNEFMRREFGNDIDIQV